MIHPQFREVVRTYMQGVDLEIVGDETLDVEPQALSSRLDEDTALVAVQYPDFFGGIEDYSELGNAAHAVGAMFCVVVNPIVPWLIKTAL